MKTLLTVLLITVNFTHVLNAAEITNVITEIRLDGTIVWTNLIPGHGYTIEQTPDLSEPWTDIVVDVVPTTMTASAEVPMTNQGAMFYRPVDNGVYRHSIGSSVYIGSVSGDTGADVVTDTWFGDEFYNLTVTEDNSSTIYLSVEVRLQPPPQMDYDLYLYDEGFALIAESSTNGPGQPESAKVKWDDTAIFDDSTSIYIEIRRRSGVLFDKWTLEAEGNVVVP